MLRHTNPQRARILRGQVLELLYLSGMAEALNADDPYAMAKGVLMATLEGIQMLPSDDELEATLRYLGDQEKGYVQVDWANNGKGGWNFVRLTTKGIDLYERTITDHGVYFPRRVS